MIGLGASVQSMQGADARGWPLVRWCAGDLPVLLIYEVRVRVQVEFNRDILEVTVWTGNRFQ